MREAAGDVSARSLLELTGTLEAPTAHQAQSSAGGYGLNQAGCGLCPQRAYHLVDRNRHNPKQQSGTDAVTAISTGSMLSAEGSCAWIGVGGRRQGTVTD